VLEFWTFRPGFLRYISQRGSNGCAEDIFQEACAKFLASNAVFVHPQPATRYFCRIIQSLIVDHFKRSARLQYGGSVSEPSWDPWPAAEERQLAELVHEAVGQLSEKDRRSLDAYFGADAAGGGSGHSRRNMRYRARKAVRKLQTMVGEK
jgi:DNA-directed RNA polymerase specialized sigma24 family protein